MFCLHTVLLCPRALWPGGGHNEPGRMEQIEGMRLNKPNYDTMTALTTVGLVQRSRAYSISPLQDPLSTK